MEQDEFEKRIAHVRQRFAAALPTKIDDSLAILPRLSCADANAIEALVVTHRRLHELCGIAPSIGFPAVGKAARAAETVLRAPAKARRPLSTSETEVLRIELSGLREAAQSELRSVAG